MDQNPCQKSLDGSGGNICLSYRGKSPVHFDHP